MSFVCDRAKKTKEYASHGEELGQNINKFLDAIENNEILRAEIENLQVTEGGILDKCAFAETLASKFLG